MSYYYALIKNKESEEYHIRKYKEVKNCITEKLTYIPVSGYTECSEHIDEKFSGELKTEYIDMKFYTYYDESAIRYLCAKIGRCVCGQCVATLYTTY